MFPVQILYLLDAQALQRALVVLRLALLVVAPHPEQQGGAAQHDRGARGQVQAVADGIVGPVEGQEAPRGDQAADVAEHDRRRNGRGARRVRHDVGRHLGVAERAGGEGARGDDERRAVAGVLVRRGQEDDVARHDEGRRAGQEDVASVEPGRHEGDDEGGEGAHDVGRDGVQLERDNGGFRVDGLDDGWGEECQALDRDIVQEEDEGLYQSQSAFVESMLRWDFFWALKTCFRSLEGGEHEGKEEDGDVPFPA